MKTIKIAFYLVLLMCSVNTLNGQRMIKNVDPKNSYEHIKFVTANSDYIFFTANDSTHGEELWRSGGYDGNTMLLKDINPGLNSAWNDFGGREFIIFNEKLIFNANDGSNGDELWISDGSSNGTLILKDIYTGTGSSSPRNFFIFGNAVYFSALTAIGVELWKTDGTEAGTVLVKNINQKTGSISTISSNPRFFTKYNNQLYFKAEDGITGSQIWKTDGTDAGTVKVSNGNPGNANGLSIQDLTAGGSYMYFTGNNGNGDLELYKSDGTESGTTLVKNINTSGSSRPSIFYHYKGKIYFKANDGINGEELWTSDGTDAGTVMVKDIYTGVVSSLSLHYSFGYYKDELYFTARGTGENAEVWKTDGTNSGTVKVSALNANGNSDPSGYFVHANTLYFIAIYGADGSNAYELFKTDGTANGTQLTYNINKQANGNAGIQFITAYQDKLVFAAREQNYGHELWAIDHVLTESELIESVCDSLKLNNKTYTTSGNYLQYYTNYKGYDSLVNLTLFVYGNPPIIRMNDTLVTWSNASSYQWQLNGQDIAGANKFKYKPTQNGNYSVKVNFLIKKGVSCNKTSDIYNLQNVHIVNSVEDKSIKIFPNPASIKLHIKTDSEIQTIQIMSLEGKILLEENNELIQLNRFSSGIYLIKVITSNGSATSKLIINN